MPPTRGRPRDTAARERALDAVRDLLRTGGPRIVTMEAVALKATVGKQSLYRWWPSKAALLSEATLSSLGDLPSQADGSTLDAWIDRSIASLGEDRNASVLRAMLSAAAQDDDSAIRLRSVVLAPHMDHLRALLTAAGHDEVSAATTADLLIGGLFFWVAARQPIDETRRDALRRLATVGRS